MRAAMMIIKSVVMLIPLFLLIGSNAWAKSLVLKNWLGLAVKGYDVVAYFEEGRPVKGSKAFEYKWEDAVWRFSSEARLAAFKTEPEKYAPQYGGY